MMRVNIAGTPIDTITAEEAALWSNKQLKDGVSTSAISIGVGGQFDIWAGNIKEAPSWINFTSTMITANLLALTST